jgi:hypothetical protein
VTHHCGRLYNPALQVLTLPPGAVVLATSPTAPHELWCLGTNVLASQFHLEFDEPLVLDKIWTRLSSIGRLNSEQSAESRKVLEAGGQHNVQMLQVWMLLCLWGEGGNMWTCWLATRVALPARIEPAARVIWTRGVGRLDCRHESVAALPHCIGCSHGRDLTLAPSRW